MIDAIIMFVLLALASSCVEAKRYGVATFAAGMFLVYLIDMGARI